MAIMKYEAKVKVYNSYFDMHDKLSLKSILCLFQDAASCHAEQIGIGFQETLDKNMFWVLSRLKFDVKKMPETNDTIIVETWPLVKGRIDFDRDFRIKNEKGEVLITGTSKWCVIDSINRNLVRSDLVNYNGEYYNEVLYNEKFRKIIIPKEEFYNKFVYEVRYCDLDHNKHMNNTNYANIISSVIENKQFNHCEINFIHEARLGDKIEVGYLKKDDGEYVVGKIQDQQIFTSVVK